MAVSTPADVGRGLGCARRPPGSPGASRELPAAEFRLRASDGAMMKADLLVWMGWDTDRTDVDLHVVEPTGEEVYWENRRSGSTGALLSRDFREGYGPECYVCCHAPPGKYTVRAEYYASHQASPITGATSAIVWKVRHLGDFEREEVVFSTVRLRSCKQSEELFTVDM